MKSAIALVFAVGITKMFENPGDFFLCTKPIRLHSVPDIYCAL